MSVSTKRSVRFGYCEIRDIKHLNDMTDEEVAAKWLQPDEYNEISRSFNKIVDKMARGEDFEEDENICRRGLDCWLPDVADEKTHTIETGIHAVLHEQNLQSDENIVDEDMLSEVYRQVVGEAVFLAHSTGLADQKEADRIYEADQMTPKALRRKGRRGMLGVMKGVTRSMRLRR